MTAQKADVGTAERERILVLVRGRRDGALTGKLLSRAGLSAHICESVEELCNELRSEAAAVLVAEAALTKAAIDAIRAVLAEQPVWSDVPVIIFSNADSPRPGFVVEAIQHLGNVTFLDRPVQVRSMLAAVRAALRSRKRQYEAGRAIESRDAFLAMLGHELRNPLGAIRLASTLLQAKGPNANAAKEHAIIERQSVHLARLVDELLDVARVTQGKIVLRLERLSLVEAVRNVYELIKRASGDHLATFELIVDGGDISIDGDRQRLEQVFSNVLTNAVKYTPRGGSVVIRVSGEDGVAVVTVNDTGVGLDQDMRARVFDVFAQAERSLDRSQGGIGVGLALVRGLVELHGGTIRADSDGPGKGSTFVLTLPRARASLPTAEEPLSTTPLVPVSAKRVVIVDDNADMRELLAQLLGGSGHQVSSAETGPEGLAMILSTTPDVAFVDIGLPEMDGLEIARRLRAARSHVRLVAVTGYGQPEDKARAFEAGFDAHLTKPVESADVVRALSFSEGAIDTAP